MRNGAPTPRPRRRRMRLRATLRVPAVLATLLVGTTCTELGFEAEIVDREPFDPLPEYAGWWTATESCSSLEGSPEGIRWFLATSITVDGALAFGAWTESREIIIVRTFEDDELTVRHEMLHDLLRGDSEHRSTAWAACGLIPD